MDKEFGFVDGVAELVVAPRRIGASDDLEAHLDHSAVVI